MLECEPAAVILKCPHCGTNKGISYLNASCLEGIKGLQDYPYFKGIIEDKSKRK